MSKLLNCFEEEALIYLLEHTKGVNFVPSFKTDYYDILINNKVCKIVSKDELFEIFLKIYMVK